MKMGQTRFWIRAFSAVLTLAVFTGLYPPFSAQTDGGTPHKPLEEQVSENATPQTGNADTVYYADYLAKQHAADYSGAALTCDIGAAVFEPAGSYIEEVEGKRAIRWQDGTLKSVTWAFDVPTDAFYNLTVTYLPLPGGNMVPRREVLVDGAAPFREMELISFPRTFQDKGTFWVNELGDQVRPSLAEKSGWKTEAFCDSQGDVSQPLRFYLTKGRHEIKMSFRAEPVAIAEVSLTAPHAYGDYKDVLAGYKAQGIREYTGNPIKINAETPFSKSSPSLRALSNNDPLCDPSNKGYVKYNTVGGASWNTGGDSITWEIDAPQAGLYKLSLRYYQNFTNGLPVYRRIEVNDEVPYAEFLSYKFASGSQWTSRDLAAPDGTPYLVFLKAGANLLTMTAVRGERAGIINGLNQISSALRAIVQKVMKITTLDPDVNFDYQLDKKIPGLMDSLKVVKAALVREMDAIISVSGGSPGAVNNLRMTQYQIDKMIADPYVIARGLGGLADAQSNIAQWISDFQNCSLEIDYISAGPAAAVTRDYHANMGQKLVSVLRTFLISFSRDYDALGYSGTGDETYSTVNAWVASAKEWAAVLQNMANEDFSPTHKVRLKINVVPTGSLSTSGILMLAIASGNAPDVALGAAQGVPFEYGIRGAAADLTQFDTFSEVKNRFLPGILIPYEHKSAVYALPESMDFSVLYYRTDIMQSLGLHIPDTWDELYATVLPKLQKNGMDFLFDGAVSSVAGSVSAAFHTFLLQNGGDYYTADGLKSALDTPQAYNAFKQFTDLYTLYDMPVTANFYMRFRSGQIPIGVSSFNAYVLLTAAAPEIAGKWDVAPIPGIRQPDGRINRSYGGNSSAALLLASSKNKQKAWEFLDWYTSAATQVRYTNDLYATVGAQARWCPANLEAFDSLSWETNLKNAVDTQREWYRDMPNVIGGYITVRNIENARVAVIVQGKHYRDSLEKAVKDINLELDKKNQEFARRDKIAAKKGG